MITRISQGLARRYRAWKYSPTRHIRRALGGRPHASIVQVGSNDGVTNDPSHDLLISHPSWTALLIEPVPFLFQRLKGNYPDSPRFRFENAVFR